MKLKGCPSVSALPVVPSVGAAGPCLQSELKPRLYDPGLSVTCVAGTEHSPFCPPSPGTRPSATGRAVAGQTIDSPPCFCSGKAGVSSRRSAKKAESNKGASAEVPGTSEDTERNQKIMQWLIEGEKEISRHRKAGHG